MPDLVSIDFPLIMHWSRVFQPLHLCTTVGLSTILRNLLVFFQQLSFQERAALRHKCAFSIRLLQLNLHSYTIPVA